MMTVYIGVGSNINPEENIPRALALLGKKVAMCTVSMFYFTPPLKQRNQPDYCNGVCKIMTAFSPDQLKFDILRPLEAEMGRVRSQDAYASRVIDLDILVYGAEVIKTDDLTVPDPDIYTRPFICIPLGEIAPGLVLPDTGKQIEYIVSQFKKVQMKPAQQITNKIRRGIADE